MHLLYFSILALLAAVIPAPCFSASLTLDASLKEIRESNLNPLLSGAGRSFAGDERERQLPAAAMISSDSVMETTSNGTSTADFYTVLNASGGMTSIIGPEADLFVRIELERQQFRKFSELNATTVGIRGGLLKQLSDVHSMRVGVTGRRTEYHLDALTGSGFSAIAGLRQQTASRFCLDEAVLYERYRAAGNIHYAGNGLALQAGYRLSPAMTSALAYGFFRREFDEGLRTSLHSLTLSGVWKPMLHFSISTSLELQRYESHPSRSRASNSIASVGAGYTY